MQFESGGRRCGFRLIGVFFAGTQTESNNHSDKEPDPSAAKYRIGPVFFYYNFL